MSSQSTPDHLIKEAQTIHPVIDLIRRRWSPRSFSERMLDEERLNTLFEAASWAASSGNEQPWQYVYAFRGTEGFSKLWHCLDDGNRPWTFKASVLIASVKRTIIERNQKVNAWASHDVGMANAHMFLQAVSMGFYCHPMAGFYPDKLRETLGLDEFQEPVCMIAVGYLDDPDKLDEPNRTKEITPRSRKGIDTFARKIT